MKNQSQATNSPVDWGEATRTPTSCMLRWGSTTIVRIVSKSLCRAALLSLSKSVMIVILES